MTQGKILERLDVVESKLTYSGMDAIRLKVASMTPAERKARILELAGRDAGLDRPMSQEEYESWLIERYPEAAYAPRSPLPAADSATNGEKLAALEAAEAWHIVQERIARGQQEVRRNLPA